MMTISRVWIDESMHHFFSTDEDLFSWKMVFKETLHSIWYWRNKYLFEPDITLLSSVDLASTILYRARETLLTNQPNHVNDDIQETGS